MASDYDRNLSNYGAYDYRTQAAQQADAARARADQSFNDAWRDSLSSYDKGSGGGGSGGGGFGGGGAHVGTGTGAGGNGLLNLLALGAMLMAIYFVFRLWLIGTAPYLWFFDILAQKIDAYRLWLVVVYGASQAAILALGWRFRRWAGMLIAALALPFVNVGLYFAGRTIWNNWSLAPATRPLFDLLHWGDLGHTPKFHWSLWQEHAGLSAEVIRSGLPFGMVGFLAVGIPAIGLFFLWRWGQAVWRRRAAQKSGLVAPES